jgi:hypothetical protein
MVLSNPTGRPLGGGEGYGFWVARPMTHVSGRLVRTAEELVQALDGTTDYLLYVDDES